MNRVICAICFMFILTLASGCIRKPDPETWKVPGKEEAQSAMLIGRIQLPDNKKENPENYVLLLSKVDFRDSNRVVYFGDGERSYVMSNNYYVIPNIKPGKYQFAGFQAGDVYHLFPLKKEDFIEVKAGQIKFVGSYDYLEEKQGFLSRLVGLRGTYSLRKAKNPTELEMLQWLKRIGGGSGWEPAIKKRINELGG